MDYLSVIDPVCFTGSKWNLAEGFKSRLGGGDLCPPHSETSAPPRQPPINTVEGPCVGAHHIPAITISRGATQLLFPPHGRRRSWRISPKMKRVTKKSIRPFTNPAPRVLSPLSPLSWGEGGARAGQTDIHPHAQLQTDNLSPPVRMIWRNVQKQHANRSLKGQFNMSQVQMYVCIFIPINMLTAYIALLKHNPCVKIHSLQYFHVFSCVSQSSWVQVQPETLYCFLVYFFFNAAPLSQLSIPDSFVFPSWKCINCAVHNAFCFFRTASCECHCLLFLLQFYVSCVPVLCTCVFFYDS